VVCGLLAIALIRYRFMGKKLANTIIQVVIGVSATNCYTRTRRKPRGTSQVSPGFIVPILEENALSHAPLRVTEMTDVRYRPSQVPKATRDHAEK
jgi:hypothetical protein